MAEGVNLVRSLAVTIDDLADAALGIKPASKVVNLIEDILPANVISTVTSIPKPEQTIGKALDDARAQLKSRALRVVK